MPTAKPKVAVRGGHHGHEEEGDRDRDEEEGHGDGHSGALPSPALAACCPAVCPRSAF